MRFTSILIMSAVALGMFFLCRPGAAQHTAAVPERADELQARYEKLPVPPFPCKSESVSIGKCLVEYLEAHPEGKTQFATAAVAKYRQGLNNPICRGWREKAPSEVAKQALEGKTDAVLERISHVAGLEKEQMAAEVLGQLIENDSDNMELAVRLWPDALRACIHLPAYSNILRQKTKTQVDFGGAPSYQECIGSLVCRCGGQFGFC